MVTVVVLVLAALILGGVAVAKALTWLLVVAVALLLIGVFSGVKGRR